MILSIFNNGMTDDEIITVINTNLNYFQDNLFIDEMTLLTADDANWFTKININLSAIATGAGVSGSVGMAGMTGLQYRNLINNQFALYKASLTKRKLNLIYDGHSFMAYPAVIAPNNQMVSRTCDAKLQTDDLITIEGSFNGAVGGRSIAQTTAALGTLNANMSVDPTVKNIYILWQGANDISGDADTGDDTYALLKTLIETQLTNGYDKVIIFTATPSILPAPKPANTIQMNEMIKSDLITVRYVDVINTDLVDELDDVTDLTYFEATGLPHLTVAGYVVAGNELAERIEYLYS